MSMSDIYVLLDVRSEALLIISSLQNCMIMAHIYDLLHYFFGNNVISLVHGD